MAQLIGAYDAENLSVDIKAVGANVATAVVSGQDDLGGVGSGVALSPINEGKPISVIYNYAGQGAAAFVAALPKVTDLSGCTRMSTPPEGNSGYAWAEFYKKVEGLSFEHTTLADAPTQLAALVSGQTDCAVSAYGVFKQALSDGKIHLVVDRSKPDSLPPAIRDFQSVDAVIFGEKDVLQNKREAVERFMRAMQKALDWMHSHTSDEIADLLLKSPDFSTYTKASLSAALEVSKVFWSPNGGVISEVQWGQPLLEFFRSGGLKFIDPADPKWSYNAVVDMSFLKGG